MIVNDKVQVDKPKQVQDFEKFYLLQTKQNRNEKHSIHTNKSLHLIAFDKYNKLEIVARKIE
jgi:hypothetical protein